MGYQTKYISLILDCFKDNENTLTAIAVRNFLNSNGADINLATVYRNLKKLVDENKLIKININGSNTSCYQLAKACSNPDEHLHLRCNQCGKLIHLDCEFMEELKKHVADKHNFNIHGKDSVIYGICSDCLKKNQKN